MDLVFDYWYIIVFVFLAIATTGGNKVAQSNIPLEIGETKPAPILTKQDYKRKLLNEYAQKGYVTKDPYADAIMCFKKRRNGEDSEDIDSIMKNRFCFDDDAQRKQRIALVEAYNETQAFIENNPYEAYQLRKKEPQIQHMKKKGLFSTLIDSLFVEKQIQKPKTDWQGGEIVESYVQESKTYEKKKNLGTWADSFDSNYKRPLKGGKKVAAFLRGD